MADFTKKAIRSSFIKLLNEKPIKQISVKDIVDDCGINRNTFYYHYQDIPDLVENIIRDDADRIIHEYPQISSLEECLSAVIGFTLSNRKAVMHIYKSVNRDFFEQSQWRVCEYAVTTYINGMLEGKKISERDKTVIIGYLKCVSFGVAMGWLESGLQDDIQEFVQRVCELKQGDLEKMLEECEIKE